MEKIYQIFISSTFSDLIEESTKKRSVKDTSTYWTLTSHGDKQMVKLRALRKEKSVSEISTEVAKEKSN